LLAGRSLKLRRGSAQSISIACLLDPRSARLTECDRSFVTRIEFRSYWPRHRVEATMDVARILT
jgi:hypothetical protein